MTNGRRSLYAVSALLMVLAFVGGMLVLGPLRGASAQNAAQITPRGPNGGPPEGLTAELTVGDARFLFDRTVPARRQDLTRVGAAGRVIVYARAARGPFDAVYVSVPPRSEEALARYLPERNDDPNASCPAEAAQLASIDAGDLGTFAFAGFETDVTPDVLQSIGTTADGFNAYVGSEQPTQEIFVEASDGLQRFVAVDPQGVPAIMANAFAFNGQGYAFADVSQLPADAVRIGCAGPFPLSAVVSGDQAPAEVFASVAGQALRLTATGAAADVTETRAVNPNRTPSAQEPSTPAAAETPAAEATEAITPEATATAPPIVPATEAATEAPTEAPTEAATEAATAAPTEVPTEVATTEPTIAAEVTEAATPPTEAPAGATAASGFPRELVVNGARYLFDRLVPIATDGLTQIDQQGDVTIFGGASGTTDRVYATDPNLSDQTARYLAEGNAQTTTCPAEAAPFDVLDAGDAGSFAFAGIETDVTPADLQEVGATPDNNRIYAGNEQPITELFVEGDQGLLRFVLVDDQGVPAQLAGEAAFGGQTFAFAGDATDVDRGTLGRVGCAGPFPAFAAQGEAAGAVTTLYVQVGDRLLSFTATGAVAPSPAATPPTEAPTEAPTATTAPTATAQPTDTATPEPTATATPAPTDTPTPEPTATPAPTETPTPEPTATATATETPVPPTDTPVPPTDTPVPTETPVPPTDTPVPPTATATPAPTETPVPPTATAEPPTATAVPPTATTAPTTPTAQAAEASAVVVPAIATPPAGLPPQIEVQNVTYIFSQVAVAINVQALVQVQAIQVQGQTLTVYASQQVQGVAATLYVATATGQVVGQYVPAAAAEPAPPPSLPADVEVQGATYVFNAVSVNVDVTTLVQVEVIQVQNTTVTVYAEQGVQGRPPRLYGVAANGQVVGQYIDATVAQQARVTIRQQPFAVATIRTPAAGAASPAAAKPATTRCTGDIGAPDANGLPSRLPRRIQFRGTAYTFAKVEQAGAAGTLTRVGCVGGFEAASSAQAPVTAVLYLRVPSGSAGQGNVYRYQAITTVDVTLQVSGQPQTITLQPAGDRPAASFTLRATWGRLVYSSVTVILFAEDPTSAKPPLIYAYDVTNDVVAQYEPAEGDEAAPAAMQAAAKAHGINPDLTLAGGPRYVLTAVWTPSGSTANGWVTFYAPNGDATAGTLLGIDPRRPELLVYAGG